MRKGVIYYATIDDLDDVPPIKSIFRMLTWQKGRFDLDPAESREFAHPVEVTVREILMESMRQLDELNTLREKLPELGAHLLMNDPLSPKLRGILLPDDLDVLQLAINFSKFGTILDKSAATDVDTARIVLKLIDQAYLRVAD